MPNPRFEQAIGVVDGINLDFETSVNFVTGTLAVFLNGQLQDFSCYSETGPKNFQFIKPPRTHHNSSPDIVFAFYLDTLPGTGVEVEVETERIYGVISEVDDLIGGLDEINLLGGNISELSEIEGTISPVIDINGSISEVEMLIGSIQECN